MSSMDWEVTPEELTTLASDIAWKEHNRYFVSEYTPYDVDDFIQELVLHVYEKMDNGFIPDKPSVAYEWMKQRTRDYWRDYFRKNPQESMGQPLSIEELQENLFENEMTFDIEDTYVTEEFERIDNESDVMDLSVDTYGDSLHFLAQLKVFLELEGFMPGREIDLITAGLDTQEWGDGTSQFLRDFRRHNVDENIEYQSYPDGTLIISLGDNENIRSYKLMNHGELE